jgi:Tol biopolymer transport system component
MEQNQTLCIMSEDGANPTSLLSPLRGFLTWMPDSSEILFFENARLDIVNIKTKKTRTITAEEGVRNVHNISADGSWLVYGSLKNGTTDLRAMPMKGGESIPVITSLHEDGHPFFSVDSKWLYYQRDHKNIFRIPGPAQNWRPDPPVQVTFFPESGLYLEDIQRTRDGKFLLYSRGRIRSDIWLLSP